MAHAGGSGLTRLSTSPDSDSQITPECATCTRRSVAEDHSFSDTGKTQAGPIDGYAFPGVHNERLAKGLAGFTGTVLVFALGFGLVKLARRRPALA